MTGKRKQLISQPNRPERFSCHPVLKYLFILLLLFTGLLFALAIHAALVEADAGNGAAPDTEPLVFLGNYHLPPMNYLENDQAKGLVVEIVKAMTDRMERPATITLMDWAEAQTLVLAGEADALIQINATEERKLLYDFSEPLLKSEFAIFIPAHKPGITSIFDLRGLTVATEARGFSILVLQRDPLIEITTVPDLHSGINLLLEGSVDAVVGDRWVGTYILADNNIKGVGIAEQPIDIQYSSIAVKKDDTVLLAEINRALDEIKQDGTYQRIIDKWQGKKILYQTVEQVRQQRLMFTVTLAALLLALVFILVMLYTVKKRKQVEEELQKSTRRYRELFENSRDGFVVVDVTGRFLDANEAFCQMVGYRLGELKRKDDFFAITPERWREWEYNEIWCNRLMEDKVSGLYEKEYIRKDGTIFPVELQWFGVSDEKGEIIYLWGVARDITERKLTEQQLSEFKTAVEQSVDCMAIAGMDGKIKYANSAWVEMHGSTVEGTDLHINDLHTEEQMENQVASSIEWLEKKGFYSGEVLHVRKDGTTFPTQMSTTLLRQVESGEPFAMLVITRDLTDLKKAEEQINKLAQIADSAPSSILVHDYEGTILYANEQTFQMSGYEKEGFMGLNLRDIEAPESAKLITTRMKEIEKGEAEFEVRHIRKGGSTFPLHVSVKETEWFGKPALLRVSTDITDRKRTENLINARDRLLLFALDNSIDAFLQKTLDEVCAFMESPIGFYHFVSADEQTLTLKAWSTDTLKHFCKVKDERNMNYSLDQAGVWIDCVRERRPVIHNDYASLKHKKGLPEGHVQVIRELAVPIKRKGRIVAVFGIGNKAEDYNEDDLNIVSFFADLAWSITENKINEQKLADSIVELEKTHRQLEEEVNKAYEIHKIVLPDKIPQTETISIAAHYHPATLMGGDSYNIIKFDNKLIIYLADVMGHGLDGAMISIFIKEAIESYVILNKEELCPQKILQHLSRQYYRNKFPGEQFVCIFLGVIDLDTYTHEIKYSSAGFQVKPLVMMGNGEKKKLEIDGLFISNTLPLEILTFEEQSLTLTPGTTIIITTDGLTEHDNGEEMFLKYFEEIFYTNSHLPPEVIVQAINNHFCLFNHNSLTGTDDITYLVLQVNRDNDRTNQQHQGLQTGEL